MLAYANVGPWGTQRIRVNVLERQGEQLRCVTLNDGVEHFFHHTVVEFTSEVTVTGWHLGRLPDVEYYRVLDVGTRGCVRGMRRTDALIELLDGCVIRASLRLIACGWW